MPICCPIGPSTQIPTGIPIKTTDFTEDLIPCEMLRTFLKMHQYIANWNNGKSLTEETDLFLDGAFTMDQFDGHDIITDVNSHEWEMLPPRDPNYSTVYQTVEEEQQKYWIHILDSTTDAIRNKAGIESNSTPNGGTDNSTMEFTKTLVEATVSAAVQGLRKTPTRTTTHAEQEQLNNSKSIMERYQITFARIEDVIDPTTNTTSKQVILPKLSDQFKQLLTGTKLPDAQRILQESMLTEIRKASESDDRVISACTLDVNQFDNVTTAALRNFNFSAQPLAADPSVVKRNITPFLFTTPPVHSVEYKERQLEGETYKYQVMIGEHSSKMDKRKTDLYYGENQVTANHVQECIANQFVFFNWVDPLEESEALGSSTPIVRRERMARPSRELSPSVPQPDRRSTQHALSVDLPCE